MPDAHTPSAEASSTPATLLSVVRRRGWLVLICIVLAAVSAGFVSSRQAKRYTTTAALLFRNDTSPDQAVQSILGLSPSGTAPDPTVQGATNVALASLGTVAQMTAAATQSNASAAVDRAQRVRKDAARRHRPPPAQVAIPPQFTSDEVSSAVSVSAVGQSHVVDVTASHAGPAGAALLANTFAQQFVRFQQNTDSSVITSAIDNVRRQLRGLSSAAHAGPAGRALADQLRQLRLLAGVRTGNVQVVQSATLPSSSSSPRTKLNLAAGGALGLVLGIALALLLQRLDGRVASPEELGETYDSPVLGVVPRTRALIGAGSDGRQHYPRALPYGEPPNGHAVLPAPTAEAFRTVNARLRYFNPDVDLRSVLVTSADRGEGKSTVAWQLARMPALSRTPRVLLLEADLRLPTLARVHGLRETPGLTEVLTGHVALMKAIQTVDPVTEKACVVAGTEASPPGAAVTGEPRLDVLVAGSIPQDPTTLLDSNGMSVLLDRVLLRYDLVVLDAAPGAVPDTIPLASKVDGVIIISSLRGASKDAAHRLRNQFEHLGVRILGVVANNARRPADAYYAGAPSRRNTAAGPAALVAERGDADPPPRRPNGGACEPPEQERALADGRGAE